MQGWLDGLGLSVGAPAWLALLLLAIPIATLSLRSLAGLGNARRALAIAARVGVLALITLALAELKTFRVIDSLTTLFVIDDSESMPSEWRRRVLDFTNRAIAEQRRPDDRAGVIVFGKSARIETPPTLNPRRLQGIENPPDPQHTDIAAAIKLALASFADESARRIVLLSDGNANRGNLFEQAAAARELKVPVDVLPVEYDYDDDVLVEKVTVPPDVKQGETISIDVVLRASRPTRGRLQIYQEADRNPEPLLGEEAPEIELDRGVNVYRINRKIDRPNFYQYTAQFFPSAESGDRRAANNVGVGFTQARGSARALLIEGTAGEHAELVAALERNGIEVDVRAAGTDVQAESDSLPTGVADLQPYDTVILANVPKDAFTDQQIELLATNTRDLGAGLIMIGGRDSFGSGRWMNTAVEKALPVDMQIRSEKFAGKSALAMIMHASEIAQGNYWQAQIAKEALRTLSSYDYAGLLHWTGRDTWLFPVMTIGANRARMLRAIDQMVPGDMPDFDPGLRVAMQAVTSKTDAMTKHIIIISDGDPAPPSAGLVRQLRNNRVTVTTVLTAAHGNDPGAFSTMQNLARATNGRFYNVTNPRALPRIYQKEVRLISRPLIHEDPNGWNLSLRYPSEPLAGIAALPPVRGIVLTEAKRNELVETPLVSTFPAGREEPWPALAHWTYGLGRAAAFTSDAGRRWTDGWADQEVYAAFWTQLARWTMRPVDSGNVRLTLRREEGRVKVVAEAIDKDENFLNFLTMRGSVVGPDLQPRDVDFRQTAPGRYEATIEEAEARGNYFVSANFSDAAGQVRGFVSSGISVPYSDEYRELRSNRTTLENLASLTGGEVFEWRKRPDGEVDAAATASNVDVFRRDPSIPPPRDYNDLWPDLLFFAAALFLVDVAVRRLTFDFDRFREGVANAIRRARGREEVKSVEYIEKLRGRRDEVRGQIERTREAVRQVASPPSPAATIRPVDSSAGDPFAPEVGAAPARADRPRPRAPTAAPATESEPPAQESYTDRLLSAKRRVMEERRKALEKEREKEKDRGGEKPDSENRS